MESGMAKYLADFHSRTIAPKSTEPTRAEVDHEFAVKVGNLYHATADLLKYWNEHDHTGDYWNVDYPFAESLEDVLHKIGHWQHTCQK